MTMDGRSLDRREFLRACGVAAGGMVASGMAARGAKASERPNILFCIADDWSWPHASIAGDPVVKTPTFDRIAREGVLMTQSHVASPSCTPSRGSVLTGQMFYRLESGGDLWSTLPAKFPVYPDLLEEAGYHVGFTRKGWGPGSDTDGGRKRNPASDRYKDFGAFHASVPKGKPFCFWFGSTDPHRPYKLGSGKDSGMDAAKVKVPPFLPDSPAVRSDICDYFFEVQRFDREVGEILQRLEAAGQLDNTLVVMTGDNGMPFPRAKSNIYDYGTHMPLAIRWPTRVKGGRTVDDFTSFCDYAPTFLEAAGLTSPAEMTGRSLLPILTGGKSGRVEARRDHVVAGMERHTPFRKGGVGYPCRCLRTTEFLYIRNFKPDRWPAADPERYGDIDDSPSKSYLLNNRDKPGVHRLFELACAKRPAEELYDLKKDPGELTNVAGNPKYADVQKKLGAQLLAYLKATRDPRVVGGGEAFETYRYYGRTGPKNPGKPGGKKKGGK